MRDAVSCPPRRPKVVMNVLGHSQIAMTMNTYSHVIPELRRTAADRMDDLLNDR